MTPRQKLEELFSSFPGIGPRQAKRFVYFLLHQNINFIEDLLNLIKTIKNETAMCKKCFRYFEKDSKHAECSICRNPLRDSHTLMIIARDVDFEHLEKSHNYNGLYFILGGTIPILDKDLYPKIRISELKKRIETDGTNKIIQEIIIAMSVNPEGEHTLDILLEEIKPLCNKYNINISTLGRGLSTGTELEYSDSETIKNALKNRKSY